MSSAINVKMLSALRDKGDSYRGSAVTENLVVVDVTVPSGMEQMISRFERGGFVKILVFEQYTNVKERKVVKLNQKSRIRMV